MHSHSKSGFTLIELLIVIAIIAILAAILFPVFASAREKARQTTCASNERQIALGVLQYIQDYDEVFPPALSYPGNVSSSQTFWEYLVDSYIKGGVVGSTGSAGMTKGQIKSVWVCPDYLENCPDGSYNGYAAERPLGVYAINQNISPEDPSPATPLVLSKRVQLSKIDSTSNVVLLCETLGSIYESGQDWYYCSATATSCTNISEGSYENARVRHSGGANFAYVDAHVKWSPAPAVNGANGPSSRDTVVAYGHCSAGAFANPLGWFIPLSGVEGPTETSICSTAAVVNQNP